MEQITVKIEPSFFEKVKVRMEVKGCKTLAQSARELMELGMRIEDAANDQEGKSDVDDMSLALMNLLQTNMIWSLETRFLMRFLIENWDDLANKKSDDVMKKVKERAATVVQGLIKNKKPMDA